MEECSILKLIVTKDNDNKGIKSSSFENWFTSSSTCEEMDLRGIDTSETTILDNSISNNSNLKTVNLTGWDTSNVTSMRSMFYNDKSLTTITGLETFDISKINTLSLMFYNCLSLEELDLSSFEKSGITSSQVSKMLTNTIGLKKIKLAPSVLKQVYSTGLTSINSDLTIKNPWYINSEASPITIDNSTDLSSYNEVTTLTTEYDPELLFIFTHPITDEIGVIIPEEENALYLVKDSTDTISLDDYVIDPEYNENVYVGWENVYVDPKQGNDPYYGDGIHIHFKKGQSVSYNDLIGKAAKLNDGSSSYYIDLYPVYLKANYIANGISYFYLNDAIGSISNKGTITVINPDTYVKDEITIPSGKNITFNFDGGSIELRNTNGLTVNGNVAFTGNGGNITKSNDERQTDLRKITIGSESSLNCSGNNTIAIDIDASSASNLTISNGYYTGNITASSSSYNTTINGGDFSNAEASISGKAKINEGSFLCDIGENVVCEGGIFANKVNTSKLYACIENRIYDFSVETVDDDVVITSNGSKFENVVDINETYKYKVIKAPKKSLWSFRIADTIQLIDYIPKENIEDIDKFNEECLVVAYGVSDSGNTKYALKYDPSLNKDDYYAYTFEPNILDLGSSIKFEVYKPIVSGEKELYYSLFTQNGKVLNRQLVNYFNNTVMKQTDVTGHDKYVQDAYKITLNYINAVQTYAKESDAKYSELVPLTVPEKAMISLETITSGSYPVTHNINGVDVSEAGVTPLIKSINMTLNSKNKIGFELQGDILSNPDNYTISLSSSIKEYDIESLTIENGWVYTKPFMLMRNRTNFTLTINGPDGYIETYNLCANTYLDKLINESSESENAKNIAKWLYTFGEYAYADAKGEQK